VSSDFASSSLPQYGSYMGGPPSAALSQALGSAKKHFPYRIWCFRHKITRLDEQFLHNQLHRYPKHQTKTSAKLNRSKIMDDMQKIYLQKLSRHHHRWEINLDGTEANLERSEDSISGKARLYVRVLYRQDFLYMGILLKTEVHTYCETYTVPFLYGICNRFQNIGFEHQMQ